MRNYVEQYPFQKIVAVKIVTLIDYFVCDKTKNTTDNKKTII